MTTASADSTCIQKTDVPPSPGYYPLYDSQQCGATSGGPRGTTPTPCSEVPAYNTRDEQSSKTGDSPYISSPSSMQLQTNLQFRFLHPDDIDELKWLCKECFPVEYPEEWYHDITKDDGRFFSLASTLQGKIVGFIVAEIKTRLRCNKEDQDVLSPSYPYTTPVAYILSLGVSCQFRCQGVGSLLLDNLLSHLTAKDHSTCKAVFLHVLSSNVRAIQFYEKRNFTRHSFLPFYYSIQGKLKDGFSYVLYLNGGHPPWNICNSLKKTIVALASFHPCRLSTRLLCRANQWLWYFVCTVFYGLKKTSTSALAQGYHK